MNEHAGSQPQPVVEHVPEQQRYIIKVDGEPAGFAGYRPVPGEGSGAATLEFDHTVIAPEFGGRGLGGALITAAVTDVRAHGGRIVPCCTFVAKWFREHPDFADVLAGAES